jgi:lipopolysaccharide/colanic/teichoic acid biosynthesis glycosyltransferase
MLKRAFDIVLSAAALIVLSPLLLVLTVLIRWQDGPAFYRAPRVGRHGVPFEMVKFRSMVLDADRKGSSSTPDDDPRMTPLGRWMRRYKIDELPQFWNVLRGDMSVVGPRPQVSWAVERYTEAERLVLDVRPGITDPASLRFANEGEILRGHADPDAAYFELIHPEKMRLSIDYVKHRSFIGDLRIIAATIAAALGYHIAAGSEPLRDPTRT